MGAYPRSHTSVAEPCFEFRFIKFVHQLLSVSPASLPLCSCKYLLTLATTLCWHSQTWVGLKATREARESEFVRTPCSFMFHPPTPGILLTFKLCMSINTIHVYTYQSPKSEMTMVSETRTVSKRWSCLIFKKFFHALSSSQIYTDVHFF